MKTRVPSFASELPSPHRIPCTSCSTHRDVPTAKEGGLFRLASTQDQLAPPPGQNLRMPDPEAVLSEAPPLDAPHKKKRKSRKCISENSIFFSKIQTVWQRPFLIN